MPAIFELRHTVRPEEIDAVGHANNLAYLHWLLDAAVGHSTAQGWPPDRYLQLGSGWVARSHYIEYLRPAFVDEEIVVLTWVAGFRKITSVRKYKIVRPADDSVLVVAETNWAYVAFDRHAPCRIPPEVLQAFELVPPALESSL